MPEIYLFIYAYMLVLYIFVFSITRTATSGIDDNENDFLSHAFLVRIKDTKGDGILPVW